MSSRQLPVGLRKLVRPLRRALPPSLGGLPRLPVGFSSSWDGLPEERYLSEKFGEIYEKYRARVSRYL